MSIIVGLIGLLLDIIGLVMLGVNYYRGKPTKRSWIIAGIGFVLIFTGVIMQEKGLG